MKPRYPTIAEVCCVLALWGIVACIACLLVGGCKASGKFESGPINAAANAVGSAETRFDWFRETGVTAQSVFPKNYRWIANEMVRQALGGITDMQATKTSLAQEIGEANAARTTAIEWKERHDAMKESKAEAVAAERDRFFSVKQRRYGWLLGVAFVLGVACRAFAYFATFLPAVICTIVKIASTILLCLSLIGIALLWALERQKVKEAKSQNLRARLADE